MPSLSITLSYLLINDCIMKKITITIISCIIFIQAFSQSERKVSMLLQTQFNTTIYDRTAGNNPWGIGLGTAVYFNGKAKFEPTIEFTTDVYLADDKVGRVNPDGTDAEDLGSIMNLFAGAAYSLNSNTFLSFTAGPGFMNGHTFFGIKPSFSFYFSDKRRWAGKISYINIFNRDRVTKDDFGTISFGIGVRIF